MGSCSETDMIPEKPGTDWLLIVVLIIGTVVGLISSYFLD